MTTRPARHLGLFLVLPPLLAPAALADGIKTQAVYAVNELPGFAYPTALDASGRVVGVGSGRAVVDVGGAMTAIGGDLSEATAINARGDVAGDGVVDNAGTRHAFLRSATAAATLDLGTLGGPYAHALAINDAGQVAGDSDNGNAVHAFLYSGGRLVDLGTLGGPTSHASGLNNAGVAVGSSDLAGGGSHAVSYQRGSIADLGTLGGPNSHAAAINDAGQVVGNSDVAGGATHAFMIDAGRMHDLGTLPGFANSSALALNAGGTVVGYASGNLDTSGVDRRAFIYQNGTLTDLNTLLPVGSGWVLEAAMTINASGQVAGIGLKDGVQRAFLLGPSAVPEPATLSAFALVALGMVARSRRSIDKRRPWRA